MEERYMIRLISDNLEKLENKVAVIDKNTTFTYGKLYSMIKAYAFHLNRTYGTGNRILLFCENSIEFIVSYFSIIGSGNTIVMCDLNVKEELLAIINDCKANIVISSDSYYQFLTEKLNPEVVKLKKIDFSFFTERHEFEMYNPQKDVLILYTSGSTGIPKGVVNDAANLLSSADNYIATLRISSDDVFLSGVPFFHSYGMGSGFIAALKVGGTIVILPQINAKTILSYLTEFQVTIFHGVPYIYKLLSLQLQKEKVGVESVRHFISAGVKMDRKTFDDFYKETHCCIHQEYGSTETGTIAFNQSNEVECSVRSVGQPLLGVNVFIENPDDESKAGTLVVDSKSIASRYVGGTPFSRKYVTGDIVEIDEENYISIIGRSDRRISIAGKKIDPVEIKKMILSMEGTEEAYVYLNPLNPNVLAAKVVLNKTTSDSPITSLEIRKFLATKLAPLKVPKEITFVDKIETTMLGKIKRM